MAYLICVLRVIVLVCFILVFWFVFWLRLGGLFQKSGEYRHCGLFFFVRSKSLREYPLCVVPKLQIAVCQPYRNLWLYILSLRQPYSRLLV